jgi:hypothetical protein
MTPRLPHGPGRIEPAPPETRLEHGNSRTFGLTSHFWNALPVVDDPTTSALHLVNANAGKMVRAPDRRSTCHPSFRLEDLSPFDEPQPGSGPINQWLLGFALDFAPRFLRNVRSKKTKILAVRPCKSHRLLSLKNLSHNHLKASSDHIQIP